MRLPEFDRSLDRHDFPSSTTELARRYRDTVLDLQDGSVRLDGLLGRLAPETFASADEARMTVYGALPVEAIGRRGYSDRDPPALGEAEHVSF